ncbi:hypothetical protein CO608_09240 [Lysobacteraceae bacterium NML08-0793]|nr:hypothetical protein CO608_09240 [Xanthomonadaceae bacterium NML08-0793]
MVAPFAQIDKRRRIGQSRRQSRHPAQEIAPPHGLGATEQQRIRIPREQIKNTRKHACRDRHGWQRLETETQDYGLSQAIAMRTNTVPTHALLPYPPGSHAQALACDWLAQQLQHPAEQLPLYRDERGRPRLAAPLHNHDVSWSHSGEQLLLVCGKNLTVGCDLEYLRPRLNALKLARRFFHPQEAHWLQSLPQCEQERAFLQLWCAKEAILKAHGHGLSFGLEKLRLAHSDTGLVLAECHRQLGKPEDWRLELFSPADGYIAAIAWRQPGNLLR